MIRRAISTGCTGTRSWSPNAASDPPTDDDGFLRSGIVDSMGMLQLVTFLQERFGSEIRDDELVPENLDSLTRVTAFVERKLARRAG